MKITKAKIEKWKRPPAAGFLQWLQDVKPKIPSSTGGFVQFIPTPDQVEFFENALAVDDNGDYKYQTITCSMPRRHSKTVMLAMLVLWRFTLFPGQSIVIMANSSQQVQGVSYKLLKQIIFNTPFLRSTIGPDNVQNQKISFPDLQSSIIPVSTNISSLYGQKISVAWVTELHQCPDPEAPQVLASSIGDTANSWYFVDSTVDPIDGPLHQLEKLQGIDDTIYCYHKEYASLDEALAKSPPWINRKWLKSRKHQLLPATFASQHLNKRSEASNNLFPKDKLEASALEYTNKISKEEFEKLINGRKYVCGGGLDRAYMFSAHADSTIYTTVAKTSTDDGEPVYYVLNQSKILAGLSKSIKKEIVNDNANYGLNNVVFEAYNCQDLATWATEQNIPNEVIHATNTAQLSAFQDMAALVREGRLFFPAELQELKKEMQYFNYSYTKNGNITFGSRKRHDDRVYSLLWAVYSLRKTETILYEIDTINCTSISKHAPYCYLRGGDLILDCSNTCPAHTKVKGMYNQYVKSNPESDLSLPQFFDRLVKVKGIKTYKAM